MDPITALIIGGGLVIGNYAVWRYQAGAIACRLMDGVSEYTGAIRTAVEKQLGLQLKDMTITREAGEEGKIVFKFSNVSIVDFEALEKQIKKEIEKQVEKELTAQEGAVPPPGVPEAVPPAVTEAGPRYQYYEVTLVIDKSDVRLGEIDYCDWEKRQDFHVTVTKTPDKVELSPDDPEYQGVMRTLKRFSKVTVDEQLNPNDEATKITEAGFAPFDWFRRNLGGQVNRQFVDFAGGLNEHLQDDDYVAGLQQVAIDRAREGDYSVLDNYLGVLEQGRKNDLKRTIDLRKKLQAEELAYKMSTRGKKFWLVVGGILVLTILVAAGIVALNIFFPGVGLLVTSVIKPVIISVFTGAISFAVAKFFNLTGGILGLSTITLGIGIWFKSRREWNQEKVKLFKEKIEHCKIAEKELRDDLDYIKKSQKNQQKILGAIVNLSKSHGETLDLSCERPKDKLITRFLRGTLGKVSQFFSNLGEGRIGDVGVNIICHQLLGGDALKTCEKINLANNGITQNGAILLADTLVIAQAQPTFKIHEIDLTGNPIGPEGLEVLKEALSKNLTITDLRYDSQYATSGTVQDDIERQLIINRYLLGQLRDKDQDRIRKLFPETDAFERQVIAKVKNNYAITVFPSEVPMAAEVSETIGMVTKQNTLFRNLLSETPTLEQCMRAFELDSDRYTIFMAKLSQDETKIGKIRNAIKTDLLDLRSLPPRNCMGLLLSLYPSPKSMSLIANVQLFVNNIVAELPKEKDDPVALGMRGVLQGLFENLDQGENVFKPTLEEARRSIAEDIAITNELQRRSMLNILDFALHPEFAGNQIVLKKYRLQMLVASHPPTNLAPTFGEFLSIYNEIPENEVASVFSTMDHRKFMELVRDDVYDYNTKETVFRQLRNPKLSEQHKKALFEFCFKESSDTKYKEMAALYARILGSEEATNLFLNDDEMESFRKGSLVWGFSWPGFVWNIFSERPSTTTYDSLKGELEGIRNGIATNFIVGKERNKILVIIDSILYPELGTPDLVPFKIHQLQKLVSEHPADLRSTFDEFISIYRTVPEEQVAGSLAGIDVDKLVELVKNDVYDSDLPSGERTMCRLLRTLDESHRVALLEAVFSNKSNYPDETEPRKKAILTSRMIAAEEMFSEDRKISNFREHYLYYAFLPSIIGNPYNHKDLKQKVEEQRKTAKRTKYFTTVKLLEGILQQYLQDTLKETYPCLRPPFDVTNFEALKTFLNDELDLRRFEFPERINGEVRTYIETIINRNRLHDSLFDYTDPQTKLGQFLDIYVKIEDKEARKNCLESFLKIGNNRELFLELLKTDVNLHKSEQLKKLEEPQMVELLTATALREDQHAYGITTLFSRLLKLDPSIDPREYMYNLFGYKGYLGNNYPKWSFEEYINRMQELSNTKPELQPLIQDAMQKDLIPRFDCLRGKEHPMKPSSFELLKRELNGNFDLTDVKGFEFEKMRTRKEVVEYVGFICQRNLLRRDLENLDLENFMSRYASLSFDKYADAIKDFDKAKVLQLISKDLGTETKLSCEKLRKLDSEHRTALLAYCFSINETKDNAYKKAVLISKLLEIEGLFDRTDKTSQAIKKQIYWAITPEGYMGMSEDQPYYNLNPTKNKLNEILRGIPEDDLSLSEIRDGLKEALAVSVTPQIEPTPKPQKVKSTKEMKEERVPRGPEKVPEKQRGKE